MILYPKSARGRLAYWLIIAFCVLSLCVQLADFVNAAPLDARPTGIKVLFYNRGVMERVFRTHQTRRGTGDYVPGLVRRRDADCLTAVNWQSRNLVFTNRVLVIDLWDARQGRWERHRCQAADWQQRRHSTGSTQRFEVDYETALAVNMTRDGTTVARFIGVE